MYSANQNTPLKEEEGSFQNQQAGCGWESRSSAVDKHLDLFLGLNWKRQRTNHLWRPLQKKVEKIDKGRTSWKTSQTKGASEVGQWFLGIICHSLLLMCPAILLSNSHAQSKSVYPWITTVFFSLTNFYSWNPVFQLNHFMCLRFHDSQAPRLSSLHLCRHKNSDGCRAQVGNKCMNWAL